MRDIAVPINAELYLHYSQILQGLNSVPSRFSTSIIRSSHRLIDHCPHGSERASGAGMSGGCCEHKWQHTINVSRPACIMAHRCSSCNWPTLTRDIFVGRAVQRKTRSFALIGSNLPSTSRDRRAGGGMQAFPAQIEQARGCGECVARRRSSGEGHWCGCERERRWLTSIVQHVCPIGAILYVRVVTPRWIAAAPLVPASHNQVFAQDNTKDPCHHRCIAVLSEIGFLYRDCPRSGQTQDLRSGSSSSSSPVVALEACVISSGGAIRQSADAGSIDGAIVAMRHRSSRAGLNQLGENSTCRRREMVVLPVAVCCASPFRIPAESHPTLGNVDNCSILSVACQTCEPRKLWADVLWHRALRGALKRGC